MDFRTGVQIESQKIKKFDKKKKKRYLKKGEPSKFYYAWTEE
jgi:hypothetical protein